MKSVYVSAAAFALTAAVNLSPALAQGPKLSGGNTCPGVSQPSTPRVTMTISRALVEKATTLNWSTGELFAEAIRIALPGAFNIEAPG
jgi:hypothetical protein